MDATIALILLLSAALWQLCSTLSVSVHNGAEFAQAFAAQDVTVLLIEEDLYVDAASWEGLSRPLLLRRNISIRASPAVTLPLISIKSSDGSVRMAEGIALTLAGCIVVQNRGRLGVLSPGLDMLAPCPANESGAFMIIQNSLLVHPVCLPRTMQVATLSNITRPPAFPGHQEVGSLLSPPPDCVNDSSAPVLRRCWPRWGIYRDLAIPGQDPDDKGNLQPTNVFIRLLDTQFVCTAVVSDECIKTLGATACFLYTNTLLPPTLAALRPPSPPALSDAAAARSDHSSGDGGSGGGGPPVLPIVLPCVLGGVAVLAVLVAWAMWRGSSSSRGGSGGGGGGSSPARRYKGGHVGPKAASDGDGGGRTCPLTLLLRKAYSTESLALAASNESLYQTTAAGAAVAVAVAGLEGHGSGGGGDGGGGGTSEGGLDVKAVTVAGCLLPQLLPGGDTPVIVTPFTQHRSDLRLGVRCDDDDNDTDKEVVLLPVVRGQGNFGRVVEGLYGGQRVAVKLVPDLSQWSGAGGPAALQSYVQEVEVLGRCCHPNVVRLLAACVTPPRLCLVMELMETSLDRLIHAPEPPVTPETSPERLQQQGCQQQQQRQENERRGEQQQQQPGLGAGREGESGEGGGGGGGGGRSLLPLDKVLHLGMEVAKGLEYLHPTIVHRDLKPGNVLLNDPYGPRPVVKLTDFGLSRLRSTVLVTRHPEAGTPQYMAPELYDITNNVVSDKSDMYSLGVLLWEMLSGQVPWQGCDPLVVAYAVTINRDRLPLSAIPPPRLPPKLARLLERLWDADPLRRPAAAEVVKQLALIQQEMARQQQQAQEQQAEKAQQAEEGEGGAATGAGE